MINEIIYEDNHIIIVNKLPGDLVQADVKEGKTLRDDVKTYIKENIKTWRSIFGRGAPIGSACEWGGDFCTNEQSINKNASFAAKTRDRKIYWAVVDQPPSKTEDWIENWLRKDQAKTNHLL